MASLDTAEQTKEKAFWRNDCIQKNTDHLYDNLACCNQPRWSDNYCEISWRGGFVPIALIPHGVTGLVPLSTPVLARHHSSRLSKKAGEWRRWKDRQAGSAKPPQPGQGQRSSFATITAAVQSITSPLLQKKKKSAVFAPFFFFFFVSRTKKTGRHTRADAGAPASSKMMRWALCCQALHTEFAYSWRRI